MDTANHIKKQQQTIARCEKALSLEKLKKRRADTRRKIELGGLVIKSGIDGFNKAIILGVLDYGMKMIRTDAEYRSLFEIKGRSLFQENIKL